MDKIEKALAKLTAKERQWVKVILARLQAGATGGLDIKKLRGTVDIFRARKGNLRIIYRTENNAIYVLAIERRREKTYR